MSKLLVVDTPRFGRLFTGLVVLLVLTAVGLLNVVYPFGGDQALFAIGAKSLAHGAVLYRDFWDLKQPGIYWFYQAAGSIAGYDYPGVHVAEVAWFAVLTALILIFAPGRYRGATGAVLTVGVYFSVCGVWHLTQLEGLVWLPLYVSLILVSPTETDRQMSAARWVGFGVMAGIVGLFKLMLVALPVTLLLVAVWPVRKTGVRKASVDLARGALWALVGGTVVWTPVLIYFGVEHQLPLMWRTFFVDPPRILRDLPTNKPIVLLRSIRWFLLAAGPLLPLAGVAVWRRARRPTRFETALAAWVVVATGLVLVQKMWWEYHFLLVLFPVGLLAAMGLEDVFALARSLHRPGVRRVVALVAIALTFGPYAARVVKKYGTFRRYDWGEYSARQIAAGLSPPYATAVDESGLAAVLPAAAKIYVLGDPLLLYVSDRPQPVAINGWSPEWFLPEQWTELAREIDRTGVDWVFVSAENQPLLAGPGREFGRLLCEEYRPIKTDAAGVWYRRRSGG